MRHYWGVEAACLISLSLAVRLRSFGVALCLNSKDYWCLKEVPARWFLVIAKTSVIITILIWCLPRIHDIILCSTSVQKHLTADWGSPASSFCPSYCTWSMTCLCTNLGWVYVCMYVCMYFSVLNLISVSYFHISLYINSHNWNKEITTSNNVIYSVLKFSVWH